MCGFNLLINFIALMRAEKQSISFVKVNPSTTAKARSGEQLGIS